MRTAQHLGIAVVFAFLLGVAGAGATWGATPEESAKAKQHFQRGKIHFELKEFKQALDEFKNAYRYVQDPVLLLNIAQCHYRLEQYDEALSFYRNYVRRAPNAANRPEVENRIAEIEKLMAERAKTGPPPISPGPPSTAPPPVEPPAPRPTPPAPRAPVASPPSPVLMPPPVSSSASSSEPPPVTLTGTSDTGEAPPIYTRWWFWAGVGAVVVTGVVTAVALSKGGTTTQVGDCAGVSPCLTVGGK